MSGWIRFGLACGRLDESTSPSLPEFSYRLRHAVTVCLETPNRSATSLTGEPSLTSVIARKADLDSESFGDVGIGFEGLRGRHTQRSPKLVKRQICADDVPSKMC